MRQLLKMCTATGAVSNKKLDTAMKQLDADGSGEVDLEEFIGYFKENTVRHRYRSCLQMGFNGLLFCRVLVTAATLSTAWPN